MESQEKVVMVWIQDGHLNFERFESRPEAEQFAADELEDENPENILLVVGQHMRVEDL